MCVCVCALPFSFLGRGATGRDGEIDGGGRADARRQGGGGRREAYGGGGILRDDRDPHQHGRLAGRHDGMFFVLDYVFKTGLPPRYFTTKPQNPSREEYNSRNIRPASPFVHAWQ